MVVLNTSIFISPEDNRQEAIEAWSDRLTPEQIEEIKNADPSVIIRLDITWGQPRCTKVILIPEG